MNGSEYLKERHSVNDSEQLKERRRASDRRKFCYTAHAPERRSGQDRREINANKLKAKVA